MQLKDKLQPYLPHIIAVLLFLVIAFAYFYPVLEGKVLKANDSTVSTINSKEINDFREKNGREPLWTNSIFSGMPAFLISTRYPGNLLKNFDIIHKILKMPVSVLFLSMLGFYILLLIFGLNPWLAITGAIAYGLSSFFFQILGAGHNTQAIALVYVPPLIGGIYYTYRHNALKGALFTAFILALEIQANHIQITYYALLCLLIFGIVEFIYSLRDKSVMKFLRTSALLIVPFIIAVGINFASLYSTYEYGKYSIRGKSDLTPTNKNITTGLDKNYILFWSYGVDETFNLLIPNYKGGSSRPFDRDSETYKILVSNNNQAAASQFQKYWGPQPGTDGPHYVGAIVFFLFILGLIVIKGPEKWWLLAATLLSFMLAWGKNFMPLSNLFIEYFPGYNKFRAVTMTLVIAELCIPLLGFLALRDVFNGSLSKKEALRGLKIAAGITGGFILLVLMIPGIAGSFISQYEAEAGLPAWLTGALIADRKELMRSDAFRSLVFILLAVGVIVGFLTEKLRSGAAILVLTLLIVFDLWAVDKRYLNADRFEKPSVIKKSFNPSLADQEILKDKSYYRVYNRNGATFSDNTPTSYFHKSIGGYHGAKLKRYQELYDSSLVRDFNTIEASSVNATSVADLQAAFKNTPVFNMLNTKYMIFNPEYSPIVNNEALGNAWFVEKPVIVKDANEEISKVNTINPASEAVIVEVFKGQISKTSYPLLEGEKIELVSYAPDELVYKYSAKDEKLTLFSEIYYPAGWKSYIDGKESDYFRANYVLRGMIVPAGDHEIRFSFKPASYIIGNKISLVSSVVLILIAAGYFAMQLKKKSKAE